jgi:uncharacterized protein
MKLQADRMEGQNAISKHGPDGVIVNGQEQRHSVIVPWAGAVVPWGVNAFADLAEAHFAALAELKPELVIFGSGHRLRFAPPALFKALMAQNIGLETMDLPAACRTYNVLLAEGRRVVAALLIEHA